ncbi:MAG: hypothetical protein Pars93KO_27700 [Parasphingorhabdus sp.]
MAALAPCRKIEGKTISIKNTYCQIQILTYKNYHSEGAQATEEYIFKTKY